MTSVTAVPIRPLAKGSVLKLWLAILALALAAGALAWWGTRPLQRLVTPSGLQYQVIQDGEGDTVTPADLVRIHYVGRLENGRIFDSSLGGQPVEMGVTGVIPGFGEGLQLMKRGGRYRLWIPPSLGYAAMGPIPPTAPFTARDTLVFDVQVVDVARGGAQIQQMQQMQELQRLMREQQGGGAGGNSSAGASEPPPAGNSAR